MVRSVVLRLCYEIMRLFDGAGTSHFGEWRFNVRLDSNAGEASNA
jgi:hypothetical protein